MVKLFNKAIIALMPIVPKFIVKLFAQRYIAGDKLSDAVRLVKDLMAQKMCATIDILGEDVFTKESAQTTANDYFTVLETIQKENLDANISVKLTALGLKIEKEFCYQLTKSIVQKALELKNFVRIDMEDHTCTEDTIDIYLRLKKDLPNVGIVLQAYLRRTMTDVDKLVAARGHFRICKGIYNESRAIAWKQPEIINSSFIHAMETMLKGGCYAGIATHDEKLVWHSMRIVHELGLKRDQYEFQMLLGVDEKLRQIIVDGGHRMRVYVPFGKYWYPYSTRRLKENPAMVGHIVKTILGLGPK